MSAPDNPIEDFRQAVAAALRALGHAPDVELAYTADRPGCFGDQARVPQPGRALPPEQVAEARGWADSFALRRRHHDARLHGQDQPEAGVARDIWNAVEQARIEAIGSADMAGVAQNLDRMTETRVRADPIVRARSAAEVPLATALGLLVRERLTGQAVPRVAEAGIDLIRADIEDKAGAHLDALTTTVGDQAAFAQLVRRVLSDLGLGEDPDSEPEQGERGGDPGRKPPIRPTTVTIRSRAKAATNSRPRRVPNSRRTTAKRPSSARPRWTPTWCPTPSSATRARRA